MRKIPTLFVRDPVNRKHVLNEVTPGCEWVLAGEGVATRKYDGTCVLIRRDGMAVHAFARREIKPGKGGPRPPGFIEADHDEVTGKTVGWEPMDQSSFSRFFDEAVTADITPGTYELCGPRINGNPEGFPSHTLVSHDSAQQLSDAPRTFNALRGWLQDHDFEGIVWHHPDGRMAKLKKSDFPTSGGPEQP